MPQIFQVLRCFKCLVFQVHQTKKSNKFSCKMCGEKQSIKRHYGLGTGQECRLQVQKLNGLRSELDEINENLQLNDDSEEELSESSTANTISKDKSKWSNFIDEDNEINEPKPDEPMYLDATEVVLEIPKKVKRFVKPKPANKRNLVQNDDCSGNRTPWSKPWPNKNEITKTDSCYVIHESTEVLNTQKENVNDFKHKLSEENIVHDIPKPKIKKVFQPSKVSKQSKWAQFTENNDAEENDNDEVENDDYMGVNDNDEVENDEYMGINDNDKVENDDHRNENNDICFNSDVKTNALLSQNKHQSQESEEIPKSLTQLDKTNVKTDIFSMCDESELDSILDV